MNDTTIHYEMLRSLFQMCVTRVKYNPPFHHRGFIVYFAGNPIMTDLCTMLQDEDYPKAENNRTDIHAIFFIKVLFLTLMVECFLIFCNLYSYFFFFWRYKILWSKFFLWSDPLTNNPPAMVCFIIFESSRNYCVLNISWILLWR